MTLVVFRFSSRKLHSFLCPGLLQLAIVEGSDGEYRPAKLIAAAFAVVLLMYVGVVLHCKQLSAILKESYQ